MIVDFENKRKKNSPEFVITKEIKEFDYKKLKAMIEEVNFEESKDIDLDFYFEEYQDPILIKNSKPGSEEIIQQNEKYQQSPLINEEKKLNDSKNEFNVNNYLINNAFEDQKNVFLQTPNNLQNLNDLNLRMLDIEKQNEHYKQEMENLKAQIEENEKMFKNKEIEDNIKNRDDILNEMFEKLKIEEQNFQYLVKMKEIDEENAKLKRILTNLPPTSLDLSRDSAEDIDNIKNVISEHVL